MHVDDYQIYAAAPDQRPLNRRLAVVSELVVMGLWTHEPIEAPFQKVGITLRASAWRHRGSHATIVNSIAEVQLAADLEGLLDQSHEGLLRETGALTTEGLKLIGQQAEFAADEFLRVATEALSMTPPYRFELPALLARRGDLICKTAYEFDENRVRVVAEASRPGAQQTVVVRSEDRFIPYELFFPAARASVRSGILTYVTRAGKEVASIPIDSS
jgi:hypothetical protein